MADRETTQRDLPPRGYGVVPPAGGIEVQRSKAAVSNALFGDDDAVCIGRYTLQQPVGAGGMGIVYRAHDPQLDREVALKLVQPHRLCADAAAGRTQLRREAQSLARLTSPYIVDVLDVGEHAGQVYLVMQFVAGQPLTRWLQQRRSSAEVLQRFEEAGRGLADAHRIGIVHRDFKPSNVIVPQQGFAQLIDFGLASPGRAGASSPGAGTLAYMAPEVRRGDDPTEACDQYSFCACLSEALHLRPSDFSPPRGRIPTALRLVIARGLHPDPAQRWPDMTALLDAMRTATRRTVVRTAASMTLLTVLLTAAGAWARAEPPSAATAHGLADALHHDPSLTRGLLDHGMRLHRAGKLDEAQQLFERASYLAQRLEQRELAARAAVELVELVGVERGDIEAGRTWLRHAEAAAQGADESDPLQADLEHARGQLDLRAGKPTEARKHLLLALDLAVGGARRASLHNDLGRSFVMTREFDTARRHITTARELWESSESPSASAEAWNNLGVLEAERGDHHASRAAYERALEVLERGVGPTHPRLAMWSVNLGNTLYKLGDYPAAKTQLDRARAIYEAMAEADGTPHPNLGNAHTGLGNVAADEGDHQAAWEHHQRALDAWQASLGPDHAVVAIAASNAAEQARQLGRLDEAETLLEHSLEIRIRLRGPDDVSLGFPLTSLGKVWLAQDKLDDAVAALERAATLRASNEDIDPRLRAETAWALARAYWARGDRTAALEQAAAAERDYDGPWAYAKDDVAMVQRWVEARRRG